MWDNKTGRSRGFGFVSFRNQQVFICSLSWNKIFFLEVLELWPAKENDITFCVDVLNGSSYCGSEEHYKMTIHLVGDNKFATRIC